MFLSKAILISLLALGCQCISQDVTLYDATNCQGASTYITTDVIDLAALGFNDRADSRLQNGIWIHYDNWNFNEEGGSTLLTWSINYCSDYDLVDRNTMSSIRYAGEQNTLNGETFSLYEGFFLSKREYWGNADNAQLGDFDNSATSIIVTGGSPWTLYSEMNYSGMSLCVYPDSYIEAGSDRIDLGYIADLSYYSFNKQVSSVRKGCFSKNVVRVSHPAPEKSSANIGMVRMSN